MQLALGGGGIRRANRGKIMKERPRDQKGKFAPGRHCPVEDRFWANVFPCPMSGCWLWGGPTTKAGYGLLWVDGKLVYAHRYSYELHNERLPQGAHVLHKCDTPACVRPDHHFLGDQRSNTHDMIRKGRNSFGERHATALTEEQARKVLASTDRATEIAKRFGIGTSHVYAIKSGRAWAHLQNNQDTE